MLNAIVVSGSGGRADLDRKKDDIGCLFVITGAGIVVVIWNGVVEGQIRGLKNSDIVVMVWWILMG